MPNEVKLSPEAAAHYEANCWANAHPEFFKCPQNSKAMVDYMNSHKLPLTVDSFERVYKHLSEEGKILVPSRATLAKMTAEEAQEVARHNGIPRYGFDGSITGYDWPQEFHNLAPVETEASPYRLRKNQMAHPEDYGRMPSKSEYAMWGADRAREWALANGHHGHELPRSLR